MTTFLFFPEDDDDEAEGRDLETGLPSKGKLVRATFYFGKHYCATW